MSPRRCDVITLLWVWGLFLNSRATGTSGIAQLFALSAVLACVLALSACGRAGPLEPPPGPAAVPAAHAQLTQPDGSPAPGSAQDTAAKSGFDTQGNPVATPSQKRSFILDPLLR
jgi:predicted small lipoprotein YifL